MSADANVRGAQTRLRSYAFRKERSRSWGALERLVGTAEKQGVRSLGPEDLGRLAVLYRATMSSLSVARSISLDRNLQQYLESLCARAYFVVYGPKQGARRKAAEFLLSGLPRSFRAAWPHLAFAALFLALGTTAGLVLTLRDPDRFYSFVAEQYAQGRTPASTTESLRAVLYDDAAHEGGLGAFATFLFSHNAQIGIASFALGFAAGVPVFLLIFMNGLILGAFAALYQSRGLGLDFWAWVAPHGVSEILSLVICGAGGLLIAESLVFPGKHTRLENLRLRGREAGKLVVGAVLLDFVAALFEGYFRQTVQDLGLRLLAASLMASLWICYFGFAGRRRRA